jgi:hypothetical protein
MNPESPFRSLLSAIEKATADPKSVFLNDTLIEAVRNHYDETIPTRSEIYFAILNRYPEPEFARLGYADFSDVAGHILEAFSSSEAYEKFLGLVCREFPYIPRVTFVHVPKTAGSYIRETFRIQPNSLVWDQSYEVIPAVRQPLLGDLIELQQGKIRQIYVTGHYSLPDLIARNVCVPRYPIFTTLRDPVEIIVSAVNYILSCLFDSPESPSNNPWWKAVLSNRFEISNGLDLSLSQEYARCLLVSDEFRTDYQNPITRYFGSCIADALEKCDTYQLRFVDVESISRYLTAEHGISVFPEEKRINESIKYIKGIDELPSSDRAYVFDALCNGDSAFYHWIQGAIRKSDKGWARLP